MIWNGKRFPNSCKNRRPIKTRLKNLYGIFLGGLFLTILSPRDGEDDLLTIVRFSSPLFFHINFWLNNLVRLNDSVSKKADLEENFVKLFGSISRARILSFLYTFEGQSFYQREIMYETGLALRAVQREIENLTSLGIVKIEKTRNRVYYKINRDSPFFKPFKEIFRWACEHFPQMNF